MEDDELFVIVTGYLPFDYTNLVVLYDKDNCADIISIEWFKQDYTPAVYEEDEEDVLIDDEVLSLPEIVKCCRIPVNAILEKKENGLGLFWTYVKDCSGIWSGSRLDKAYRSVGYGVLGISWSRDHA
ncbi:hypothetical protein Tco_1316259 [Tanacetum coccineum]